MPCNLRFHAKSTYAKVSVVYQPNLKKTRRIRNEDSEKLVVAKYSVNTKNIRHFEEVLVEGE